MRCRLNEGFVSPDAIDCNSLGESLADCRCCFGVLFRTAAVFYAVEYLLRLKEYFGIKNLCMCCS